MAGALSAWSLACPCAANAKRACCDTTVSARAHFAPTRTVTMRSRGKTCTTDVTEPTSQRCQKRRLLPCAENACFRRNDAGPDHRRRQMGAHACARQTSLRHGAQAGLPAHGMPHMGLFPNRGSLAAVQGSLCAGVRKARQCSLPPARFVGCDTAQRNALA